MRYIFLTFSLCFFISYLHAGKIAGIITDTEGKILPFASVFIKGTNKGTNANSEGRYSITLAPGQYTLVCQYVGYKKEEKNIIVGPDDLKVDFKLTLQEMMLGEVILKNGEDPAYEIIRQAIKKRKYHQGQLDKFQCEVYTKGQLRVRSYPKKLFGQKVDFEDGDTSKQKMLYLSETVSNYYADKPNKEKVEVISSKVSGQSDGLGLAAPRFFSLYDNNISIGSNLNPRGFISPISDNALNYYRYKLEGTFYEDGKQVSRIKIVPKRKFEPLFSGYLSIVEDDWLIHSADLVLTKQSQMEQLDTLRLVQLFRPVNQGNWFIASQVIYPAVKILGFDAYGSFINIYSNVNTNPEFSKKIFDNTILKYTDSSSKKTVDYWEKTRPVPLMQDELIDYKRKDSLEIVRKDPRYLDSISKVRNKVTVMNVLLLGQTFQSQRKRTTLTFIPLFELVNFNAAEGLVINPAFTWSKRLDTITYSRRSISISPSLRYGFANGHFNGHATFRYNYGKQYANNISLSGGKRVFQFNNNSPIGERGNTLSSLLSEENRIKSYEAVYLRSSYRISLGQGFLITAGFQYQDRRPLDNRTNYTWRDRADKEYTPNYPNEIVNENISPHKVFYSLLGINWQPGARYIELPDRKINIGSKYPVFSLQYIRSFDGFLGSDADFSKWRFSVSDNINLKLRGLFRYRLGMGGFIDNDKVQLPDYNHFNGNISTFATEYLNSFQLLPIYQYSNTSEFYSLAHLEYNLKGFLTNKIPVFRRLNFYLVTGANGFYINGDKNYYEWFVGFDNIFKQIRIDFVQSYQNGRQWQNGLRVGLSRFRGQRGDDWP
ncbi:MAG: carboxypeptidase-like regulatory domain-containing protein [Chitinophagaceae bacterium]|nr:carboxypeptidase-like regulatory domain-containing protein [Chitinophagaceae bacterium]